MTESKAINVPELLKELEGHLTSLKYGQEPTELYQPIDYIMQLGGKRIRPLLALLAYSLYKDDYQSILNPASAIEVFHNFTLMHDDIMDEAPLRRGNPTVHEKWNANTAILSGDVMLVKAYDMLLEIDPALLSKVLRLFNKTAAEVCEGQQMDMNFETRDHVNEEEYISMIRLKTAVLLGFSLQMGATLAGAGEEDAQALYDFGVNVGIGFQLKDDLLDVYADKAKFGKQVGGDIIANKKTFLLIKAKESASDEQLVELNKWLEVSSTESNEQKVKAVTSIFTKNGINTLTENKMASYFEMGFYQLKKLKVNNPQALKTLKVLTEDLINRES
ncbi:polyprenyl synthetase family protein [Litoribacter alkaliphilus]|uniref:Polyprenyl synthetase family protein n=1 Tax=Litoribacter ruber TaxID=702568 RepID=A0AAP2G2P5_9BACT|nr:polyprenyl synthetase family protein [Litoribacter alkaliphilus]MBS9522515.1 polyprenyl synthetase family protein [Litoribacter alkaliphilus]